jgi:hypothetical protein
MSFIANTSYQVGDSEETVIQKIAQSCGLNGNANSFQCLVQILQAIQSNPGAAITDPATGISYRIVINNGQIGITPLS